MKKVIFIFLLGSFAKAETPNDIRIDMDQLKTNMENSENNLGQYSRNLNTVTANLQNLDSAIEKLAKMQRQVEENTKHAETNKLDLDQQALAINNLIKKEQSMSETESLSIASLRKKIEDLQSNQKKRGENIVGYKKRLEQVGVEKIEWDDQKKNAEQILTQISFKENQLSEERKTWASKEKDYRDEVSKWTQEATYAKTNYKKYRKISSE